MYFNNKRLRMTEISSFWYTPKGYKGIGLMEILTIKSWLDNGYKFHLYTYNLDDKIFLKFQELFSNFILKDANEIVPFSEYFSDDRGAGVAAFSDYFRFNLLYQRDALWVDLDMVCLNHMDLSQEYIFTQEIDKDETKPRITTSFLKFPKNSDFGKNLIQEAKKIIDNKKIIPWGVIGPWFLAEQVEKWDLGKYKWDYKQTCQIPWYKVKNFIDKGQVFDEGRPCLHLFSEMWKTNKMNKNLFYKNGIYGSLLTKYYINDLLDTIDYPKRNFFLKCIDNIKYKLKI
uniref:Alpha 1,4-glycosyltransferase domain-containing protein n=2 Tax=Campylobacter TaxID=194 RepID=B0ZTR9_CAMJU|nr:unknown [Campylobacter jejuni]